ncbi:putative hexosyltransferase [Rosa chinensis]|uniref:Putative hexosyltransferase n=1 Tax=Rosa chinensis TaxID=74649 RepID=A0A2P6RBA5_ROSCH|nr:putative hexosyltransferase [Rosa chinensis]
MASQARQKEQPHFVLVPLMAQGHMIPMIDIARLFAEPGVIVSLVTTPYKASRFESCISRARDQSGLPISIVKISFSCQEVGLPMGSESLDTLLSRNLLRKFFKALSMLQEPLEKYLEDQKLQPWCIISDKALSWTSKLKQLRSSIFQGLFSMESKSFGVVVNSFNALELGCAEELEKVFDKKVWCIGLVSLCYKSYSEKFSRGNKSSIDESQCLQWLESMQPRSVIYVCLGSLCRLVPSTDRAWTRLRSLRKTLYLVEERFKERITGRGLLIKGWAPQVLILSSPVIGGFLTHCGWNSSIEGACSESWSVGEERWGEEGNTFGGEEGEKRRKRATEIGEKGRRAMEQGGSSHSSMSYLIQDVRQLYEATRNKGQKL